MQSSNIKYGKSDIDIHASVQEEEEGGFKMRKARSVDDMLASKRRRVSEIKHIMYENALKIRDREGKLDDLMEKGTQLEATVSKIIWNRRTLSSQLKLLVCFEKSCPFYRVFEIL